MEGESKYLRVVSGEQWRSICRDCFRTTATANYEDGLETGEAEHNCPGKLKPRERSRERVV